MTITEILISAGTGILILSPIVAIGRVGALHENGELSDRARDRCLAALGLAAVLVVFGACIMIGALAAYHFGWIASCPWC